MPILTRCEQLIKKQDTPPLAKQTIRAHYITTTSYGKQVGNYTSTLKNRANSDTYTDKSQGQRGQNNTFHQDQRRDNTNSNHPRATSTQKGKKNQRNHQNSRADPKNRRRPEPTKDGGTTPCTPSTVRVSSSKPYSHFRRSGSNKNSKNSASPEQWSKPSVRTLFWCPLLNPRAYSQYSFSKKFVKELECGITNKAIHNLSSYSLTYHDSKLLGLGLNFIPPSQPPQTQLLEDNQSFAR